jgi:hypothetical protein
MAYYDDDFEIFAADSMYDTNSLAYPTWTPDTEHTSLNAAAYTSGLACADVNVNVGYRCYFSSAPFFAAPIASTFDHHTGFVGATTQHPTFGSMSEDQGQVLISTLG